MAAMTVAAAARASVSMLGRHPREDTRRQLDADALEALGAARADARRPEGPLHLPLAVDARLLEAEDVLHRHHLPLHAGHLAHVRQLARAVREAADLDDDVQRRGDLLPAGAAGAAPGRPH